MIPTESNVTPISKQRIRSKQDINQEYNIECTKYGDLEVKVRSLRNQQEAIHFKIIALGNEYQEAERLQGFKTDHPGV